MQKAQLKRVPAKVMNRIVGRLVRGSTLQLSQLVAHETILEFLSRLFPIDSGHPLMRVGPSGDGGYLIPDDLGGVTHCFSPGVAGISGFEEELARRGISCLLADYSVESPAVSAERIRFVKKFVGAYTDGCHISLDEWMAMSLAHVPSEDLILQMDIEGAEYETLLAVSLESLQRFRILVVEFHFVTRWFENPFFRLIVKRLFDKLLDHFDVVHMHPNNYGKTEQINGVPVPPLLEVTFLRKDRLKRKAYCSEFPHPSDANNVNGPSVVLPKAWHA